MADKDSSSDAGVLGTTMPLPWILVVAVSILGMLGYPTGKRGTEKPGGTSASAEMEKERTEGRMAVAANQRGAWKTEPVWQVLSDTFGEQIFAPVGVDYGDPLQDVLQELSPPMRDDLCFVRAVCRLNEVRERLKANGTDAKKQGGVVLESMIATLADPIETHYPLNFDEGLEAIQQGFQSRGFTLVRQSLPWSPKSTKHNSHKPGVLLFRRGDDPECPNREMGSRPDYLLLFVVGESPTAGIDREALQTAVSWSASLFKATAEVRRASGKLPLSGPESAHPPFRIIGPTFSGSVQGLAEFVVAYQKHFPALSDVKQFTICSGSATAKSNEESLAKLGIPYSKTVVTDDQMMNALLSHLKQDRGLTDGQIAIVTETTSGYGQKLPNYVAKKANTKGTTTEVEHVEELKQKQDKHLVLTYPLSLSQMRTEMEKETDESPMGLPAGSPMRKRNHDVTERVSRFAKDVVPIYSHAATGLADRQLESLIRVLKDRNIRAVGLMGTNLADKVFLAQQLRREFADLQFFTLENHLLYTHSEYSRLFQGMLIGSSYPLNPDVLIQGSDRNTPKQFTSDAAEGTYHATRKLLGVPNVSTPSGWLCVVGNDRIWPLKEILTDAPAGKGTTPRKGAVTGKEPDDCGDDPSPKEPVVVPAQIHSRFDTLFPALATSAQALFAMGAGLWWFFRRPSPMHWKPQTDLVNPIQTAGLLGLLAAGGYVFALSGKLTEGLDGHGNLVLKNLVLCGWWGAVIALTCLLIAESLFTHVRSLIRLVMDMGSLPWFRLKPRQKGQIELELPRLWSACRSVWERLLPMICGWVVLGLVLAIWFSWCLVFLTESGKSKLSWTAFRSSDWYNQVNPAVPVLFLAGALYVWGVTVKRQGVLRSSWTKCEQYFSQNNPNFQELADLKLSESRIWCESVPPFGDYTERHSGSETSQQDSVPHTPEESEHDSIRRLLNREVLDGLCDLRLPAKSQWWISGTLFLLLGLFCLMNSIKTSEGPLYDLTIASLFASALGLTWSMIVKLKWAMKELLRSLRALSRSALHHAVGQIDPRLRAKVANGILGEKPDAAELQMIRGLLPEPVDRSLQSTAMDYLTHTAMATASGSTDTVLEPDEKTSDEMRRKNDQRENFVFSLLTIRIREVFWQIRNLATATVIVLLLQFFAMVSYPFQTNGSLRYLWIGLFLWACYVLFRGIVDFNRNQTLSELSGTPPNKLSFDRTFFVPLVQYLLIPAVVILSYATPAMGSTLFNWTLLLKSLLSASGGA
jgi:hypothetical protein